MQCPITLHPREYDWAPSVYLLRKFPLRPSKGRQLPQGDEFMSLIPNGNLIWILRAPSDKYCLFLATKGTPWNGVLAKSQTRQRLRQLEFP